MATKKKQTKKITKTKTKPAENTMGAIKKSIEKKYGNMITKVNAHKNEELQSISSGIISLDVALGNGGFVRGRIYEVFGPNSSGKTTLTASVLIEAQKRGLGTFFIDAEHALDPVLFESYGVDISSTELYKGFDGEENIDVLEKVASSGEYAVVVVDSVSALVPTAEVDAGIGDQQMGLHARLMSKALRRLVPIANRTNVLIIFINQLRLKIGTNYGNPETTTGGEALGFWATGRISVRGGEAKTRRIENPEDKSDIIGHTCLFSVEKNKVSIPFRKAEANLMYAKGFDNYWEIMKLSKDLGIIEQFGAWYKYKDKSIAQGEWNMRNLLEDDDALYNELRAEVLSRLGLDKLYEQNS